MPGIRGHARRGNLYVRVTVKIPVKLNPEQRELLEAFAKTDGLRHSAKKKRPKNLWQKVVK
jgi:DnaJ-class molecular chaperone